MMRVAKSPRVPWPNLYKLCIREIQLGAHRLRRLRVTIPLRLTLLKCLPKLRENRSAAKGTALCWEAVCMLKSYFSNIFSYYQQGFKKGKDLLLASPCQRKLHVYLLRVSEITTWSSGAKRCSEGCMAALGRMLKKWFYQLSNHDMPFFQFSDASVRVCD